jgi:hypothetical protein
VAKNKQRVRERELPERWSTKQKTEVVLRLIRGENLGELSERDG